MKLIKIMKNSKSLHFRLSDGRLGVCYESGYVRVQTKGKNMYNGRKTMYQINKMIKVSAPAEWNPDNFWYKRVTIDNCIDRIQHLLDFDNNNCQPIPTVEDRGFNTAYGK
jgi:hypothetical protein